MPARKHDEGIGTPLGLPRNLIVPYVLLFLKNWSAHGYQILQTLTLLGFAAVDPATVYRTLRQMEREGLVLSSWETGVAGPARRTYKITSSGEELLNQWAQALGSYQAFLDRFFNLYANGGTPPTPAESGAESAAPPAEFPAPASAPRARATRRTGRTERPS
jgi:poly-beta-hydroxybutyrate-responsive repressor